MTHPALLALISFMSGSIPFGYLIARAKHIDIRSQGSGNIGATNVGRVLGRRYFFLCLFLDMMKGLLPTLWAGHALDQLGSFSAPLDVPAKAGWWLLAMVAAVLGHVFTPWLKFKGGKGVATALGALLGVFPVLTLAGFSAFLVWLTALMLWRYISLSSILAGLALPICVVAEFVAAGEAGWIEPKSIPAAWPFLAVACLLGALVVWTHRANIKRLRAHAEPKVGQKRPTPASGPSPSTTTP